MRAIAIIGAILGFGAIALYLALLILAIIHNELTNYRIRKEYQCQVKKAG